ncbi:MAG: ligase-associated DNA damage response endonuclease PdeM [Bacteroidia bacterium]|nr:ligase-associated DNA damage response endonuclease PdeM [Bacteroidia bacterium]
MQTVSIHQQSFTLLPEKAIYWHETNALLVSDLHLGKATHFRKHGIQAPSNLGLKDLLVLHKLLEQTQASRLFIIGDLFHSELNHEWYLFEDFMKQHIGIAFILIRGNHDLLPAYLLKQANLKTYLQYEENGILLNHKPVQKQGVYVICGHIHPGVLLQGKAKQTLRLPCFYFGPQHAILPAFGNFTGLALLEPNAGDHVFVIADGRVIEL